MDWCDVEVTRGLQYMTDYIDVDVRLNVFVPMPLEQVTI